MIGNRTRKRKRILRFQRGPGTWSGIGQGNGSEFFASKEEEKVDSNKRFNKDL